MVASTGGAEQWSGPLPDDVTRRSDGHTTPSEGGGRTTSPELLDYESDMARRRRHKVAEVSQEAHRGWQNFARTHGVTVAALAEAFGLFLAENEETPRSRLPAQLRKCIEKAKTIQWENRQRGD